MSHVEVRSAAPADAEAVSAVIAAAVRVTDAADDPPDVVERVTAGFAPVRDRWHGGGRTVEMRARARPALPLDAAA